MNDTVLFKEKLPRYVFRGSRLNRRSIFIAQLTDRIVAAFVLLGTIYLALAPKTDHDSGLVWTGIILGWIACATLIYSSERRRQLELDGSVPATIFEDRISIPSRLRRKLTGKPDFVRREEIDGIEIKRGEGSQYIAYEKGIMDGIVWKGSPIELVLLLRSGKKIRLGYKPPSTVREIADVLATRWGVRIDDPGSGMGRGTRYNSGKVVGEYSYDEIMNMGLFKWQQ